MNWILAGLIAGLVAWFADYFMWSKVFTTGMESYGTMEGVEGRMGGMMVKSAVSALAWGVLFAYLYRQFMNSLWVDAGPLAGMELATTLWLSTVVFVNIGTAIWYDKARRLLSAQVWAWLVRTNAAGIVAREVAEEIEAGAEHPVRNEDRHPPFRDRIGRDRVDAEIDLIERSVGGDPSGKKTGRGAGRTNDAVQHGGQFWR